MSVVFVVLLCILAGILLSVGIYFVYVLCTDRRIEDHENLEIRKVNEAAIPVGKTLRITSWNIGFAAYSDDFSFFMNGGKESRAFSPQAVRDNTSAFIEVTRAKNADIMMFQEVDESSTRTYHINEKQMIMDAYPRYDCFYALNYHSAYLMWPLKKPHGASRSGMLTFARYGVQEAERRQLPIEKGLRRFLDLDRCYSIAKIPAENGRNLYLYTLHLSAYTSDGSIATEQLRIIFERARQHFSAGDYVIIGGDFNKDIWIDTPKYTGIPGSGQSWAKPFPIELIPEGFRIANTLNEKHIIASGRASDTAYRPGKTFVVTLDAFIVSDNIKIHCSEVLDEGFKHSDHNPILLDFTLNPDR